MVDHVVDSIKGRSGGARGENEMDKERKAKQGSKHL